MSDTRAAGSVCKLTDPIMSVAYEDACFTKQIETSNYPILSHTHVALQLLKFEFSFAITTVEIASLNHHFTF
jgi:hypothetical protein